MTDTTATKATKDHARDYLLGVLAPGDRLLVLVSRVNSTGDSRRMFVVANGENGPVDLTYYVSLLLGLSENGMGLRVSGGGMDMRWYLISLLGRALFDDADSFRLA
jgi:hypothetical protein